MCHQREQCLIAKEGLTDLGLAKLGFPGKCLGDIGVVVQVRVSGGRGWCDSLGSGLLFSFCNCFEPILMLLLATVKGLMIA